ncbi:MAG: hypothetical protein QMD04_13190 [Anaerolineales bacterium]|nr:hypothetical protein [Anaerolineales bacterium]
MPPSLTTRSASPAPVDWTFLDRDDGPPGEPADWVRKQVKLFGDDPEIAAEILRMHSRTRNIPTPATPKRCDPNEPPFVPPEDFEGDEEA